MIAGNCYQTRPDEDDGWGTVIPLCREYSSSRSYPKTKALAAIPQDTTVGSILEVHIVKILDGYGIEVAIPSICKPGDTSYVVKSREAERFVNGIHDHKEELTSNNELLTELQGSGRSEVYEEWALPSTKETCAGLSTLLQGRHPYSQKEPFLRVRRIGKSFVLIHHMEDIWQCQFRSGTEPMSTNQTQNGTRLLKT